MILSLALATAALLAAEPSNLPPNHPPIPSGTQASPARPGAAGALPEGHPPLPSGGQGLAPSPGALPEGHPPMGASGVRGAAPGALPEGHPPMSGTGRMPPSAEELLRQLDATQGLRDREKSFEVASSLGKLYYTNGRTSEAMAFFFQAEEKAVATRALYLEQRKKLGKKPVPSAQEAGCGFSETSALEAMAKVAEERARKGDVAGAAACARAALEPVLQVEVLRGHALYLSGDREGALVVYGRVLEVAPTEPEALFARSALLYELKGEDVKALRAAHEGFEAFLAAHPGSPREGLAQQLSKFAEDTAKAGGRQRWKLAREEERRLRLSQPAAQAPMGGMGPMAGHPGPMAGHPGAGGQDAPPQLTQEMVDAIQNTERTPELEAGLARLVEEGEEHLARGRYDEALGVYRRVVPFQPDNGRAKAGMAWALVGLGRPMADRIWGVAVSSDAAAVERLGDTLLEKGDAQGAKALWGKLLASAPDYPNKAALQAKASR
jgi:tetratricopeptide (TPR) repeat protein